MSTSAIAKFRESAAAKSRQLAEFKNQATPQAMGNAAIIELGAFGAGFLDEAVGEVGGAPVSTLVGVGAAVAGIAMKSPKLIYASAGMCAPLAHDLGKKAAQAMFSDEPAVP